jgi:hypothetical protein
MKEIPRTFQHGRTIQQMAASFAMTLVILVNPSWGDPAGKSKPRTPPPAPADIAKAENDIHELFKSDYASEIPVEQRALSRRLLIQAFDSSNDLASRYVLSGVARPGCQGRRSFAGLAGG